MSLATRCTACGTVFRVVQDQLRVSAGWVRCGRCGEVFNAIESLVDAGPDRPVAAAPGAHASRVMETLARVSTRPEAGASSGLRPGNGGDDRDTSAPGAAHVTDADGPDPGADEATVDAAPASADAMAQAWSARRPDRATGEATRPDDAVPARSAPPPTAAEAMAPKDEGGPVPAPGEVPLAAPMDRTAAASLPGFVRQVDRAARWRHPGIRALMLLACLVASTGLGLQVHATHHDWLAARWPALQPLAQWLCGIQGCTLDPPRRIEALAVDSSGLVRAGGPGTYRLMLGLRNRSEMATRLPAVELTLSDATGRTLVRRVLQPAELGWSGSAVPPGAGMSADVRLRVAGAPVVGYTIEIFYP